MLNLREVSDGIIWHTLPETNSKFTPEIGPSRKNHGVMTKIIRDTPEN